MAYANHEPAEAATPRELPEPPPGTVLSFVKYHGGKGYTYVGLRVGVNWYLTGSGTRYTWAELKHFAEATDSEAAEFTRYAPETEGTLDA